MRTLVACGALSLVLLVAPQVASARDLPSGGVTREEVADWLRGRGMTANVHNDDRGERIISSNIAGVNFDVYFYACNQDRCASIQYAAGWTPLAQGTQANINAWNKDKRYVRAYLDNSNNVWGEYDIDVSPGGTWEQMDASMERWKSQIAQFKSYFGG